jgi:hypothetical protein
MIDLSHIALCAVDSSTPGLAARAIRLSSQSIRFGDIILFSHTNPGGDFNFMEIAEIKSRKEYSSFVLLKLPEYVKTEFVLIVQWDGYVISPSCWDRSFTQYDYIGAVWPWHTDGLTVGNGGFSLRSKRLLDSFRSLTSETNFSLNEDEIICRVHRRALESKFAIKFADPVTAGKFSYERALPTMPTFGFHGLFNMWRHVDDTELDHISKDLPGHVRSGGEYCELMAVYFLQQKYKSFCTHYALIKKSLAPDQNVYSHIGKFSGNEQLVRALIQLGECCQKQVVEQ